MDRRRITDIGELPAPDLIWNYDPKTGRGPLHITEKRCKQNGERRYLTRCGAAMYPDHHIGSKDKLSDFRFCKRCGSESDFIQARERHDEWWRAHNAEDRVRRARETAEREAAWEARVSRVKGFASFLVEVGLRVGVENGVAKIEHGGYEYELREVGTLSSTDE